MSLVGLTYEYWYDVQTHARDIHHTENILASSLWSGFRAKTEEDIAYLWMCMSTCDRLPYLIEAARRIALQENAYSLGWIDLDGEETLVSVKAARIFCEEMIEKGLESEDVQMWLEDYVKIYNWERKQYQLRAKDWLNGLRRIKFQTTEPSVPYLPSYDAQMRWESYGNILPGYQDGSSSSQHIANTNTYTSEPVLYQRGTLYYANLNTPVPMFPRFPALPPPSYDTVHSNNDYTSKNKLKLPVTFRSDGKMELKPPINQRISRCSERFDTAWCPTDIAMDVSEC